MDSLTLKHPNLIQRWGLVQRWGLIQLLSLWIHSYYCKQVDNNPDL